MSKKEYKEVHKKFIETIELTNEKIKELDKYVDEINTIIKRIQDKFDSIRKITEDHNEDFELVKQINSNQRKSKEKISEKVESIKTKSKIGLVGVGVGTSVATAGPSAVMGLVSAFGTASTGTAISSLSGAAASNAALAWIGGGTLATGGGGIAAGNALLALAGPIGLSIAAVSMATSGFFVIKNFINNKNLYNVFEFIDKRNINQYELVIIEIDERIRRIKEDEQLLNDAINDIESFGLDYEEMTEQQQYQLGTYVNLMKSSSQLISEPIMGLQPKFLESDYTDFAFNQKEIEKNKNLMVFLCNWLYKMDLTEGEKKSICNYIKSNKKMLKTLRIKKEDIDVSTIDLAMEAVGYKYSE